MANGIESSIRDFVGTWHIVEMEIWDKEYFNIEVQAYLRIRKSGTGNFQFGLVSGQIDGHVEESASGRRFSFTWEGQSEMDPVSGSGWLKKTAAEKAEGMINMHMHDRSSFRAVKAR